MFFLKLILKYLIEYQYYMNKFCETIIFEAWNEPDIYR